MLTARKIFYLLGIAQVLLSCTTPVSESNGGGGTETTNALIVVSNGLSTYGHAPEGSVVALYHESYNPFDGEHFNDSVIVDSNRIFQFKTVNNSGFYNIVATNSALNSGATIQMINLCQENKDSIHILFDTLGAIGGTVLYQASQTDTQINAGAGLYVYCEGMGNVGLTDSSGEFVIVNIPVGTYRLKIFNYPITGQDPGEKMAVVSNQRPNVEVRFILGGGE